MAFLGVHPRPQADRGDVPLDDDLLLPGRRRVRPAAAAGTALPAGALFQQPHLQRLLHPPRVDDDLSLHHPGDPVGAGELLHPSPHRGPRRRLPPPEPCELLGLRRRLPRDHRVAGGADGHGMDLLHAVLGEIRRRGDDPLPRDLPHRHVVDPHGAQLHRHDPQDARPGDDVAPAPPLHLGDVRHEHHPGGRHAGGRGDVPPARRGARAGRRVLRSVQGGRPGPVPALLLVLLAPGGLRDDPPGDGDRLRGDPGLLPQADLRVRRHRLLVAGDRLHRVPRVGPSHVHLGDVPAGEHDLLVPHLLRRRSHGGEGVQLDRHALQGVDHLRVARCSTP